jgi:hypothetical protein
MSKEKVELEQVTLATGDTEFRVLRLTNRLEPAVGSTIDRRHVKDLIDRKSRITVVITPRKD